MIVYRENTLSGEVVNRIRTAVGWSEFSAPQKKHQPARGKGKKVRAEHGVCGAFSAVENAGRAADEKHAEEDHHHLFQKFDHAVRHEADRVLSERGEGLGSGHERAGDASGG